MFYKLFFIFILSIHNLNLYAGIVGISINKQKDFFLPELDNYSNFTVTGHLVDNYIANISYINSDFTYSLLFYIHNTQNYLLSYDNIWKSYSNEMLTESQKVNISYNKKNILGFSLEYLFYKNDNISFKIGINLHMIQNNYSINYIHNYETEQIDQINKIKKYAEGDYITEEIFNNTSDNCLTSNKSDDFEYINNEDTEDYEILSGFLICHYNEESKKIINNTEHDDISKSVYKIAYSPYFIIEMEILKNLYLNAKVGINLYNSIIMGYNKPNINFKINTPKYSSYYSLAIVYQIDF